MAKRLLAGFVSYEVDDPVKAHPGVSEGSGVGSGIFQHLMDPAFQNRGWKKAGGISQKFSFLIDDEGGDDVHADFLGNLRKTVNINLLKLDGTAAFLLELPNGIRHHRTFGAPC